MSTVEEIEKIKQLVSKFNATSTIVCEGVPYIHVANVWHKVWPLLQASVQMRDDNPTEGMLLNDLLTGQRQLWIGFERDTPGKVVVALLTQIFTRSLQGLKHNRIFALDFVGGDRVHEWKDLINYMQIFAEFHGCNAIEICDARNGAWKRILKDAEFRPVYTLLRKEIQ